MKIRSPFAPRPHPLCSSTALGIVPYVNKSRDITTPMGQVNRDTSELGDISALARYTVWSRDQLGSTMRLAPFVGIETSTGDDSDRDSLAIPLERRHFMNCWHLCK